MKISLVSLASTLALAGLGQSHYIFQQLTTGGTRHPMWRYIRQHTGLNHPVESLSSTDLRCNKGALSGGSTETVSMRAGDSFTFHLDVDVYHQGPVAVYMSRASGAVSSYDGSGDWFKIAHLGPTFGGGGVSWPMSISYTFSLPTCIASGEYLLRIEQLGIHNPGSTPQFYLSCAQVSVTGGGSSNPAGVKIPGHVRATDPGYTANIYNNFNSYVIPGPAVFSCSGGNPPPTTPNPPVPTTPPPTTPPPTTPNPPATTAGPPPTNCADMYAQCGGEGWSGPTCCRSGTCRASNQWYSQCL